ncbi:MAG: 4Fe-4S dicluster domain-containing protein [Desulfurococcales archaeon]|nr:4Fe-4S dicluster domain-containing protein [Desulfurococcales archaeon]
MARYGFVINLDTCIGCGACVAACSEENSLVLQQLKEDAEVPLGGRRDILVIEKGKFPSTVRINHHHTCMHCDNAPCVHVCPTGASYKTEEGAVLIDYDLCIGCKYCIVACPYNARYVNEALGGPDKCTMCYHRITKGLEPACASSCPTDSIVFGDLDDPNSEAYKLSLEAVPLAPEIGTKPRVYVIPPRR